jgi:integrase
MPRRKVRDRDGVFIRKGSYYISFIDAQGCRRQRKLKGAYTLTQARALRAAEQQRVEKAQTLGYVPPTKATFTEIVPRYLNHQKARITPAAYRRSQGIIESHLKGAFGQRRLADIRRVDVQRYITERSANVAPGSVIKELNTLKHMLNLAVEWELIPVNPCGHVKAPRVPAGRVRYLQPTELRAVLEGCPDWLRGVVALLAFTGMRRSELLGLRWVDLDRQGCRILLPQTKNGDGRTVWLNALACQVLDSIERNDARSTDRIFSANEFQPNNVSLAFLRSCRKVGILDFRLHDLRHTAASWMRMQGADIHTVALLLGHKDLRMAARYQHLSPAHLQDAVKGLDCAFGPELSKLSSRSGEGSKLSNHDAVTIEPKNGYKPLLTTAS